MLWHRHVLGAILSATLARGLDDIPSLGLGTWLSERDKVSHAVEYALGSAGYNHIDAALIYKNEDKTGEGIAASGVRREDLWVTSKLWNTDHRPSEARGAVEKSIADLGVAYLDLYLVHWPVAFVPSHRSSDEGAEDDDELVVDGGNEIDRKTSLLDTWRAMESLVHDNLTRHIGVSNFSPQDLRLILDEGSVKPYAHEFETHPYLQQQAFVDWHRELGIRVIAYSPLANTNPQYGSKSEYEFEFESGSGLGPILDDDFWKDLARNKSATVAQTILAWGLARDTVVIPKSVSKVHIDENKGALDITFTEEEMRRIAKRDKKTRMNDPGRSWGVKLFEGLDDPTKLGGEDVGYEDDGEL